MIVYVKTNSKNRLEEISNRNLDNNYIEIETNIDFSTVQHLDDYLYQNGEIIYSPDPEKQEIRNNIKEISKLKANLQATDYIACKIAEGAATTEEYATQIAQRQAWRDRINELENNENSK